MWSTFLLSLIVSTAASSLRAVHDLGVCPWTPLFTTQDFSWSPSAAGPIISPYSNRIAHEGRDVNDEGAHANHEHDAWGEPSLCNDGFCVWSNPGYSKRGISVITTETNEPTLHNLLSAPLEIKPPTSHFRVEKIAGKGLGLKATRLINRGERIMAIRPVMLMHLQLLAEVELEDMYRFFEQAVQSLPKATRKKFLGQAADLGGHQLVDIMYTNSFQLMIGDGQDGAHYGNYPEVSRFNHDCRPK
jgi:hypothetical protein